MIKITQGKGFHMTFANGYTASVQFGPGNYCDNYREEISEKGFLAAGAKGSTTAECARFDRDGNMVPVNDSGDMVVGHLTADQVLAFLNETASLK